MPISNGFGSCAAKLAAQLRKKISAVIALTLPILSINPGGVSGATVAVKENIFTYPGILSFELESLDERERACASPGHVETVATILSIARQQNAKELSMNKMTKKASMTTSSTPEGTVPQSKRPVDESNALLNNTILPEYRHALMAMAKAWMKIAHIEQQNR